MAVNMKFAKSRFAYAGLDRLIHERARLGMLTSLTLNPRGLRFGELKYLCALTDGNLNRHLQVLERAGMVEIVKWHDGRRSLTVCRITNEGLARYLGYLATLEQVLRDAARVRMDKTAAPRLLREIAPL